MKTFEHCYVQSSIIITTIGQRHSAPQFQPAESEAMFPLHKHLLIRKSLRCKECEHNLSKPEYNPISTKFKIQLIALHHIPEIRIFAPPDLHLKKESKLILTLCNPSAYNTTVSFLQAEQDDFHNTKVELPKHPVVVLHRDEAAMYDVTNQTEENFKDDASVIAFRKANKIGFYVKVKPDVIGEDVKITFRVQHEYRNTAVALPTEKQELQNVSLTHTVYINLGQVKQGK
ncbi:hypothetical protein FSP39_021373 [Pinctada imbricata]|uniref:Dynactin subunit 4 n=1 Tax=Pinctada imbricata TaxID=66713 RepID=A0AA89C281_PINIB|nr:hypothetical protein FSP39_021373 [Pinctada imbricata]